MEKIETSNPIASNLDTLLESEGKTLNIQEIIENPYKKPLLSINEMWKTCELNIHNSLVNYIKTKDKVDKMIADQPLYSETEFVAIIRRLLELDQQVIQQMNLQKRFLKESLHEMMKIINDNYQYTGGGQIVVTKEVFEEKVNETVKEKIGKLEWEYNDKAKKIEKELDKAKLKIEELKNKLEEQSKVNQTEKEVAKVEEEKETDDLDVDELNDEEEMEDE